MNTTSKLNLRAQTCIAQGALTNSKHPRSHVQGVFPTHALFGKGGELWVSAEGGAPTRENAKKYIDYICGLGANFLGYGSQTISDAIIGHLPMGNSHSLPTHHEIESAEALKFLFPWVERFKFTCSGTEACMAAVRIARAHTGRLKVLSEGYHGWSDLFVSLTSPAVGVPPHPDMKALDFIDQVDGDTAAVIIEPVILDWSKERGEWLKALAAKCKERGALLIFDEVITGFRFKGFSVARYFDVCPDLIVIGKAMAGGFPLSAVGGKAAVMDNPDYFVSGTFFGHIAGHVACKATVAALRSGRRYNLDTLWTRGEIWLDRFNKIAPDIVRVEGYPTRGAFKGDQYSVDLFRQEACKAGVLFGPSWFYNWSLIEHDDHVLGVCLDILGRIKRGEVALEGERPQSPFAAKVRKIA